MKIFDAIRKFFATVKTMIKNIKSILRERNSNASKECATENAETSEAIDNETEETIDEGLNEHLEDVSGVCEKVSDLIVAAGTFSILCTTRMLFVMHRECGGVGNALAGYFLGIPAALSIIFLNIMTNAISKGVYDAYKKLVNGGETIG